MVPASCEYAVLLGLFLLVNWAVFPQRVHAVLHRKSYWRSQALFLLFGFIFDLIALHHGWWVFSSSKLIGLSLYSVPAEEFALFVLVHFAMCVSWEAFKDDLA